MLTENAKNKTLVIVGPTGSGKTGVAIEIALNLGGEIISADSRAIYRDMDIGTAKPTEQEMKNVRHFGFDLIGPGERYTVADFKEYCVEKIVEIKSRNRMPIIAGGTGLYVDAVIYDYQFNENVKKTCSDRTDMRPDFVVIGIKWDREELRERLSRRVSNIFDQDIVEETEKLAKTYGWDSRGMTSNVYAIVRRMMHGEISREEAEQLAFLEDWHLAKRQMTWFKRNKNIIWLKLDEIENYVYNLYR